MTLRDLFLDVLRTLWSHKLRAFLTMFGIAWGIVSIVLMVAAGEGLREGQARAGRNLGKDVMIVFHGRTSLQAGGQHAGRAVHWDDQDVPGRADRVARLRIRDPGAGAGHSPHALATINNGALTVTGSYPPFGYIRTLERRRWPFLRLGRHARGSTRCFPRLRRGQAIVSRPQPGGRQRFI